MATQSKLNIISDTKKHQPPWYKEGLNFRCTECGKCCTGVPGYVWVTKEEIARISEHLGLPVTTFMRTYIRQKEGRFALIEKRSSNYDCVFLKDNKCSIYQVRPTQCRTFPWWPMNLKSKECWEKAKEFCEGIRGDAPTVDLSEIEKNLSAQQKADHLL